MLLAAIGGAGALQRAVHRRVAGVEELGDLGGVPADDVAQEQHRALARRQVLERGDEREADGLAGLGQLGGVAVGREHAAVGHGQHPLRLGQHRRRPACRRATGPLRSIGRARRLRPFSMSRHTLVAMRYSHDRSCERPSKPS